MLKRKVLSDLSIDVGFEGLEVEELCDVHRSRPSRFVGDQTLPHGADRFPSFGPADGESDVGSLRMEDGDVKSCSCTG